MKQMVEKASCTWRLRVLDGVQEVEEGERNRFPSSGGSIVGHGDGGGGRRRAGCLVSVDFSLEKKRGGGGFLGRNTS
jgi:hypothetical protein